MKNTNNNKSHRGLISINMGAVVPNTITERDWLNKGYDIVDGKPVINPHRPIDEVLKPTPTDARIRPFSTNENGKFNRIPGKLTFERMPNIFAGR